MSRTSHSRTDQHAFLGAVVWLVASVYVQGCASSADTPNLAATGGSDAGGGAHTTGGSSANGGVHSTGGENATGGTQGVADASLPAAFITWAYKDTSMGLYVPAPTGKPLPVVIYLHGCHNDPVYSEYWLIPAVNALEPCAVFLPTAPPLDDMCADWGGTYDTSGLRPAMINALAELDRLIEQYGFDTKREYLYGESMGGEGVYKLLVEFPQRFAGAVAAAGYTLDTGASQMAKTPLWIFHGTDDSISPLQNDRAIHQSIVDAGGTQVKYTEYPGLDHVPGIEQARVEPGLFEWLLAQRRN